MLFTYYKQGVQWNPDFSNPRFFEPPDFPKHGMFPLDLLQSNTVILPPDFSNPRFFETPDIWNQFLPPMDWKKFRRKSPSSNYYSVAFI